MAYERVGGGVRARRPKRPPLKFGSAGPPPSSGGSFGGGGGGAIGSSPIPNLPSIAAILAGDPMYQAAIANLNAQGVYDLASRNAAINEALVRWGEVPKNLPGFQYGGQYGFQPDSTTSSLAQQNTTADRKSTRLNSSHIQKSRMPSSA